MKVYTETIAAILLAVDEESSSSEHVSVSHVLCVVCRLTRFARFTGTLSPCNGCPAPLRVLGGWLPETFSNKIHKTLFGPLGPGHHG